MEEKLVMPVSQRVYGEVIYWLTVVSAIICMIGPVIAMISPESNVMNPHYFFAEIFAGNCVRIGIPVLTADENSLEELQSLVEGQPQVDMKLDIASETLTVDDKTFQLGINAATKTALLKGTWNTLDELLVNNDRIDTVYQRLAYISNFA